MVSGSLQVAEVLSVAVAAGLGGAAVALGETLGLSPATGIGAAFALTLSGGVVGLLAARNVRASPAGPALLSPHEGAVQAGVPSVS